MKRQLYQSLLALLLLGYGCLLHANPPYHWLATSVNARAYGDILAVVDSERLWLPNSFIENLGLRYEPVVVVREYDGQTFVNLDTVADVEYQFHLEDSELLIEVPAEALRAQTLSVTQELATPEYRRGHGAHLTYDFLATRQDAGGESVQGFLQPVYYNAKGSFINNLRVSVGEASSAAGSFQRLDSFWTQELFTSQSRIVLGDFISADNGYAGRFRLGGLQWRREFAMRPRTPTFAAPVLEGSARLPSAIELYVDGVRRARLATNPGPFAIEGAPIMTGQGTVTLVQRNILGEVISRDIDFYVDPNLLRKGLLDFDAGLGWKRTNFLSENFEYGSVLGAIEMRYGISDRVTGEFRGSASRDAGSMDLRYLFRPGEWPVTLRAGGGILQMQNEATVVTSRLGLDWRWRNLFLNADYVQHSNLPELSPLGDIANTRSVRAGTIVNGFRIAGSAVYRDRFGDFFERSEISVARSFSLGRAHLTAQASAFRVRDQQQPADLGVGLQLTYAPVARNTFRYTQRQDQQRDVTYGYSYRSVGDLGPAVRVVGRERGDDFSYTADLDYRFSRFSLRARTQSFDGAGLYQVGANGAVGVLGGQFFTSRTLGTSYALVDLSSVPGSTVYWQNREISLTDRNGQAVIPVLVPFQENILRVDAHDIPLSTVLDDTQISVVPASNTGIHVKFPVRRVIGVQFTLMTNPLTPVPSGALIKAVDGDEVSFFVGDDGESYVEIEGSSQEFSARWNGTECRFRISVGNVPDEIQPHIGAIRCF